MKILPAGMQTALDSGATTMCHCWLLTRPDGVKMGFTDHDNDLTFGTPSITYEALAGFGASSIAQSTGFNVDNLDAVGALQSNKITEDAISAGLYDNAEVEVYRVDWSDPNNRMTLLKGNTGEVIRGRQFFKTEVRSLMHHLNQPQGRLYRRYCDANLGDTRCGVNLGPLTKTASVITVLSKRMFRSNSSALDEAPVVQGWFTNGLLTWTSGANNGRTIEVKYHSKETSGHLFDLWEPMPLNLAPGDSFTIRPGCDKAIETCAVKFSNVTRFRGFPRMPGNDAISRYVNSDDRNDGSSLFS